jgi:ankyrin repeat protein
MKAGLNPQNHDGYNVWEMPLSSPIVLRNVRKLKQLIDIGADVNSRFRCGDTPLVVACRLRCVSALQELVKAGADVNLKGKYFSPMFSAITTGDVSMVKELVNAGADVNLNAPLNYACENGYVSVVRELVKAGADVNLQSEGHSPLTTACARGNVEMVEGLLKAGADVNIQEENSNTPLIAAVRNGCLSMIKCLLKHGSSFVTPVVDIDVSAVYRALVLNKSDIVNYFIQEQNKIDAGQYTGNVHLFNCLVDIRHAGVKLDSRDDVVVTDTSVLCIYGESELLKTFRSGGCDALRNLLGMGMDVNQSIQLYGICNDVRPLLYTMIDGYGVCNRTEKVKILLDAGADINIRVRYGKDDSVINRWQHRKYDPALDKWRYRKYDPVLDWWKYREYDSLLDGEGVSVLERTRQIVFSESRKEWNIWGINRVKEYERVMCLIKKHVRRYSV